MAVIRASRPSFRNKHDKIAFAIHATFLASGYVLTSTGPPALSDSALSSFDEAEIEHWFGAFVYEKDSKKMLVKCRVMNDKLLVDDLVEGGSKPVHLEINVADSFRNKHDYFAPIIHATFLASGYVLTSIGPPALSNSALSSSSSSDSVTN